VQAVVDSGFSPGVYYSHRLAAQFIAADNRAVPWVFQLRSATQQTFVPPLPTLDPSQSSFSGAKVLQYVQNGKLTLGRRNLTLLT